MWQKEKLLVLSNFFFRHYVFKKTSAAEASESVYMRERLSVLVVLPGNAPRDIFQVDGQGMYWSSLYADELI